jgi:WD40 repeat protein
VETDNIWASGEGVRVAASAVNAKVSRGIAEAAVNGKILTEREIRVHDAPVTAVAWHPTLPVVATASEDRSVKIWDLRSQTMVQKTGVFLNMPNGLYWSPDGRSLAVQSVGTATFIDIFSVDAGLF